MDAVEAYILDRPAVEQAVLDCLYALIMAQPGMSAKIRYNIPFFYCRSWVCYTNPREGGIELAFLRGLELSNEQGLLQARGRKMVAGVIYHRPEDIREEPLLEVLAEALLLDEQAVVRKKQK